MTGAARIPIPPALRFRAIRIGRPPEQKVRYRPASWERALIRVPVACRYLRMSGLTQPAPDHPGDRTVVRNVLQAHLAAVDLADTDTVLASFVLVVAWGSGVTNTRSLRYTPFALADPIRAAHQLTTAIETMRRGHLVEAYQQFELPGVGQSSLTRWFALAGRRSGRRWQPLILDARVHAALDANGTPVARLAGGRQSRAVSYAAYVHTMHRWAEEVRKDNPSCRPATLEWLLSQYGRSGWGTS
jgi:hypothetical protein